MTDQATMRRRLLDLIRADALRVAAPGETFTLASGRQSHYYVNGKELTLRAEGLWLTASLFLDALAGTGAEAVGGMTLGADPIIGAMIALSSQRPEPGPLAGFIVRKAAKDHGLGDRIAGPDLSSVRRVAFVEDTTTTGGSTLDAIACVRAAYPAVEVVKVLSIVDRQEGAVENFAAAGYTFAALFGRDDLGV